MSRLLYVLVASFIVGGISGCASAPAQTGNSAEMQRAHAEKAHRELSSDVK